jgi:ABC-2 type transport system ATP-binding protein
MNAIEIYRLSKNYGKISALHNMTLDVPEGTIYGLVGPNGAGKTSLIKALVGSLRFSSGSARIIS